MKNGKKIRTILLVAAVVVFWTWIGFDLNDKFNPSLPQSPAETIKKKKKVVRQEDEDYELIAHYRDPFEKKGTKTYYAPQVIVTKKQNVNPVKVQQKLAENITIRFAGLISSRDKNRRVAHVNLNGTDNMVTEGEVKSGVRFLKITNDSLKISYDGRSSWIIKN